MALRAALLVHAVAGGVEDTGVALLADVGGQGVPDFDDDVFAHALALFIEGFLFGFVIGYFLLLLAVAWRTSRNADNASFFIGNKNSNWVLVAFGMIGTLFGLIIMLGQMADPTSIGNGMAIALITTLYGAVAANAFFLPLAEKLGFYHNVELLASCFRVFEILEDVRTNELNAVGDSICFRVATTGIESRLR